MTELSLHVLDVAENSTKAKAALVTISVEIKSTDDEIIISIIDDGCGMTAEQVTKVTDPFYTTRTTRKVGLGVPFFKMAAEATGGNFSIQSEPGVGTTVRAVFGLSHIDRMPLGDMNATIHQLIIMHPECDFLYIYKYDDRQFTLDTREFKEILGDIPFDVPEVSAYLKQYMSENESEVNQGQTNI